MPNNRKPRKRYQRREVCIPMTVGLSSETLTGLKLTPHLTLEKFRLGQASEDDWHTLAVSVNLGSVMGKKRIVNASESPFPAAIEAMTTLYHRSQKTGRWVMTGDELRVIGETLLLCDDLHDASTRRDIRDALNDVLYYSE